MSESKTAWKINRSELPSRGVASGGPDFYKKLCNSLYVPGVGYNKDVTGKYCATRLWERMGEGGWPPASPKRPLRAPCALSERDDILSSARPAEIENNVLQEVQIRVPLAVNPIKTDSNQWKNFKWETRNVLCCINFLEKKTTRATNF